MPQEAFNRLLLAEAHQRGKKGSLRQMGTGKKASTKMQKHIRLSHVLVTSLAFRSLRSASVKVLVELCDRYNGSNNGTIHMGGRLNC